MDGTPNVTQKPILPGESFTYEFTVPDVGTYWDHPHAHSAEQVGRGLLPYPVLQEESKMTQGLEIARPAAGSSTPSVGAILSPATQSCCAAASAAPSLHSALPSWIGSRRVLAVSGLALGGAGLALGWDWLAAVGIAPLIVAAAPCLVMCALGLCMMGKGNKAGSEQPARVGEPGTRTRSGSET